MRHLVTAVQYPNVLAVDCDPIPIDKIVGFTNAPCYIESTDNGYIVIKQPTKPIPPPTEACPT